MPAVKFTEYLKCHMSNFIKKKEERKQSVLSLPFKLSLTLYTNTPFCLKAIKPDLIRVMF